MISIILVVVVIKSIIIIFNIINTNNYIILKIKSSVRIPFFFETIILSGISAVELNDL